jgi:Chaperone of endosialidase
MVRLGMTRIAAMWIGLACIVLPPEAAHGQRVKAKSVPALRLSKGLLLFGTANDCRIQTMANGPAGLLLRDPSGIRILPPDASSSSQLLFGPTDDCSISVAPEGASGLLLRDPRGVRILNPNSTQPSQLLFGPTDACTITADPSGPAGLNFRDPRGFRFEGDLGVDGALVARSITEVSSRSMKEQVTPISDALATLRRLQGVRFRWRAEHGGGADVGFIAEDVAEVLPEIVHAAAVVGAPSAMNYGKVAAVVVEAVKTQQEQIERLARENADLHRRLAALEARLEKSPSVAPSREARSGRHRPGGA